MNPRLQKIRELALPLLAGNMAAMGAGTVDTIMLGHYSALDLASFSVAVSINAMVYVFFMGLLQGVQQEIARAYGAKDEALVAINLQQGFLLSLVSSGIAVFLLTVIAFNLHWFKLSPEAIVISKAYILVTAITVPLSLVQRIFQMQANACGQQKRVMWLNLATLAIKALLSWLLIYGYIHGSVSGALGAALATGIAMVVLFPWFVHGLPNVNGERPWQLFKRTRVFSWPHLKPMLQVGLPNSVTTLADVVGYTAMALLVAKMGTTAAGAHQIIANFTALMFFVPYSVASACCILVNKELGAGQTIEAKALARYSLRISLFICLGLAGCVVLLRPIIAGAYTSDAAIQAVVITVFLISCFYHIFDGQLAMVLGLLRCWEITKVPMLIYVGLICVGALSLGWLLAYQGLFGIAAMGVQGFWLAAAICACLTFVILRLKLAHSLK